VTHAEALFRQLLPRLGDYREHMVVSGGIARDLYRYHPGFTDLHLSGATTKDVDFAVPDPLHHVGTSSLHAVLLKAGLRRHTVDEWQHDPVLGTVPKPVACRYFPAALASPFVTDPHIEFITPVRTAQQGNARPQGDDLIAFSLNYVSLLLDRPVTVEVPELGAIRLPHPLAYIVQKTLIRPERQGAGKQAKDQADAFQVLVSLNKAWPSWRDRASAWREHPTYGPWLSDALARWQDLYAHAASPGALEVAAAYRSYAPTTVVRVFRDFIAALGPPGVIPASGTRAPDGRTTGRVAASIVKGASARKRR
jgi:hypothetical protein